MASDPVRLVKRSFQALKHASAALFSARRNVKRVRSLRKQLDGSRKVLAVGLIQHIGDIVASEPVVRRIRCDNPEAFIVWCVRDAYHQLVESFGLVDATVPISCLTEWILLRRFGPFDQIIDLHVNKQACSVCAILLRKSEDRSGITIKNYYDFGSLTEIYARIAGINLDDSQPGLRISHDVVARVNVLNLPDRFLTMHCRSEQRVRDWNDERWSELAQRISAELGLAVVEIGLQSVVGSNADSKNLINLCGRLSLLETAEVIRRSSLFIGIDSGPAHLANAVGTPGIVILGTYFGFASRMPYSGSVR